MKTTAQKPGPAGTLTAAAALAVAAGHPTHAASVTELITRIRTGDPEVRGDAWQNAGPAGAPAIGPLSDLLVDPDYEVARSAKRAMWKIVRHAGRPNAGTEARSVERALLPLLGHFSANVRREALWMLSEIGANDAVAPLAGLLQDREVRDDARMALQRIPGEPATMALQTALPTAPEEFRYNLAEALRKRGVKVRGYPSRKLVPDARPS